MNNEKSYQLIKLKTFVFTNITPITIGKNTINDGDIFITLNGVAYKKYNESRSDEVTHIEVDREIFDFIKNNSSGEYSIFKKI